VMAVLCATMNLDARRRMVVSDLFHGLASDSESYMPNYTPRYGKMPMTETPKPF